MELKTYFEQTRGTGVLATADGDGRVNTAIYSRPHFMEDGTLAFIMRDRLSHANLETNPHAAYLFMEEGAGFKGKRLYLTQVRQEKDSELLYALKRRCSEWEKKPEDPKFLVFFQLDRVLPLIGGSTENTKPAAQ